MKHAITSSYIPPEDVSGVAALMSIDEWVEPGLKLEGGKHSLGFPFMYLLLTGVMGIKVRTGQDVVSCIVFRSRVTHTLTQIILTHVVRFPFTHHCTHKDVCFLSTAVFN